MPARAPATVCLTRITSSTRDCGFAVLIGSVAAGGRLSFSCLSCLEIRISPPSFGTVLMPRTVDRWPSVFSNTAFEIADSLCLTRDSQKISRPLTWKSSTGVLSADSAFFPFASSGRPRNATLNAVARATTAGENASCAASARSSAPVRTNVATSYPSAAFNILSMARSSASARPAPSKTTFPLAMNVSTFAKPSPSNSLRRRSIFTTWPPTLMARRKAMYLAPLTGQAGDRAPPPRGYSSCRALATPMSAHREKGTGARCRRG